MDVALCLVKESLAHLMPLSLCSTKQGVNRCSALWPTEFRVKFLNGTTNICSAKLDGTGTANLAISTLALTCFQPIVQAMSLFAVGCGSSSSTPTTQLTGTYVVNVTATASANTDSPLPKVVRSTPPD